MFVSRLRNGSFDGERGGVDSEGEGEAEAFNTSRVLWIKFLMPQSRKGIDDYQWSSCV